METCKNDILLSFIIPVYNVEAYLQECVDSILYQMTDMCEIILIDDGSTDSSGDLCDQYTEKNSAVKVIHKENGGLSSARNTGLAFARGKYVAFIDSDDKIFSDSITDILLWIKYEGADVCFLQAVKFYSDGTQEDLGEDIVKVQLKSKNREEAIKHLASRPKYPGSAWAKLYKREFLISNTLHFPNDRRYSEDLGFIRDCILCANTFDVLEVPYYQYRQNRKGSITNKITSKNYYDLLRFITESTEKLTANKTHKDPVSKAAMAFVAYEYSVLLYVYASIPEEEKKEALFELKRFKWTLRYAGNKKVKSIAFACGLFGIRFTSFLLENYRKTVEK